jgi:hypothetical protein
MNKNEALKTIKEDILEGLKKAKSIMFMTEEQIEEVKEGLSTVMETSQVAESAAEAVVEQIAQVENIIEQAQGETTEEAPEVVAEVPVVEEEMSEGLAFKVSEIEKSIGDIYQMIKEMQNLQLKTSERVVEFSTQPVKENKGERKPLTQLEKQMEYIRSLQESMK